MIDRDLAELYGVENRVLNQAVQKDVSFLSTTMLTRQY